jgi:hypothetical protein
MRIAVPALASLALVVLSACGGVGTDCATAPTSSSCTGQSSTSNAPILGSYSLKLVDGKPLPGTFADSSIEAGTLVVKDSGWTQTTVVKYRVGGSGNPNGDTLSMGGGWRVTGSSVELLDGNSTAYTGTFTSTSLTLTTKTATILGYSK